MHNYVIISVILGLGTHHTMGCADDQANEDAPLLWIRIRA
jgi:hypothetical protein